MRISLDHLSFKYNKKDKYAIKDINLVFDKSEIVFIMGHTGSGKSTLVQHLNGLLVSNEGSVVIEINDQKFVLNKDSKEKRINDLRKNVGLVFQFPEYQLFETTVIKDVMFGPMNFYKDSKVAREMASEALNMIGIDDSYYERSPFELSGGEKRKIAIAGVLASNPSILIMDEPTSSLDPNASIEMMRLIKKIKDEGKLVIIISHDTDLCYEYADRVIIMVEGEVARDSSVDEAFNDKKILNESSLVEPFVSKVKSILRIQNKNIRSIKDLKEVINNE